MEPYDTEPVRYGTYAIAYGTCTAMQPHLQPCSVLLKTAMRRYAEHAAPYGCNEYTTCRTHAVPLRSQGPSHLRHASRLQLQTSALALQEPIRPAARGAARASRRALGGVHGRMGIPVGVVNYSS